jgi:hypothetical protein
MRIWYFTYFCVAARLQPSPCPNSNFFVPSYVHKVPIYQSVVFLLYYLSESIIGAEGPITFIAINNLGKRPQFILSQ